MFDKIVELCSYLLNNYPGASACREYLDGRLSKDSQKDFNFGYFPGINNISLLTTMIGFEELEKLKLFYHKEIEDSWGPRSINSLYFENYPLIMPYHDTYGNIVGLVGRSLLSDDQRKTLSISKYKNTVFQKGNYLFGLHAAKQSILEQDSVYIVEGQFDVIKAHEAGFKNIVALGNSNMTSYQFSIISRYTNNIFLLLDSDEAGDKGRAKIISVFGDYANIRNFYLPKPYKDIDEYLTENSYDSLSFEVRDKL